MSEFELAITGAAETTPREVSSPAMLRRVAMASCGGTRVEWCDFFVHATAAGFTTRSLGGLVFGDVGDKKAPVTTLLIAGIATFH